MQRPSPARADLLREFIVSRFSSNKDAKAQGATTKRQKYFSSEALDVVKMVSVRGEWGGTSNIEGEGMLL